MHELTLYEPLEMIYECIWWHNVCIEMFVLHELILYVFEDGVSALLCTHSVGMEMFVSV